jgi:uncharacterized 2Fe-2S/4Fe-4S cluster protein (DUF4445 family)
MSGQPQTVTLSPGDHLLAVARSTGVDVTTTCGGRGRCRSCRVKLVTGEPPPPTLADKVQLGDEEINEGYRLACQYVAGGAATLRPAPPLAESAFQILTATAGEPDTNRLALDSGVTKRHLPPTSDIEGLISLDLVRRIPAILEEAPQGVTVATFEDRVMAIEPGDTSATMYGMAFDIGTTTVVGYLLDLTSGETLATVSGLNPQTVYGGDLISRIAFAAEEPANLGRLRSRIVGFVNALIGEACAEAGVEAEHLYKVVVVGNTCMHHLFLGIDPASIGRVPYAPVIRHAYACPARDAGLRANRGARLFLLPLVAGFVGADTVGMILSTGLDNGAEIKVAVDIGTNAEVVMSGPDGLMACSSPAGPALEGGQIRCGMRAALGAIDRVRMDGDGVEVHTIGEAPPLGICGSGLIDAVAALLDAGIVAPSGRMLAEPPPTLSDDLARRLRHDAEGVPEFVLVPAGGSGGGKDIVVGQKDIRHLQLAKAAIGSGLAALEQIIGVGDGDIVELLLAGGFGNYLNLTSARRIGLIPDIPESRVRYVANAAGLGAQMALLSETARQRADHLAAAVNHISLAEQPDFQSLFMAAIAFPETITDQQAHG